MTQNLLSRDNLPGLHYQLRRSERAKKTRIVVSDGKIEVVAPPKVSEQRIKAFVHAQRDWIETALKRLKQRAQTLQPLAPAHYAEGVTVPYHGLQIPLTLKTTSARYPKVQLLPEHQFLVYLPQHATENQSGLIKLALENWMKQQTRRQAQDYIELHSQRHQLQPRSLRIKTQKSRWGSCGPYNDINLNWLLILAPPIIMEYVIIHELCHVRHKNHSQAFWQLVADHMPDYLRHRQWLKQHGASLMHGL
jgi:predicted metal-dependent hydrolase